MGLLRSQSKLSYRAFTEGDRLFKEFKGALGENFVVQLGNDIIPIEIKSGKSVFSPSIIEYKKNVGGEKNTYYKIFVKKILFIMLMY
ncbi:MAG: hypothetical protein L6U99_04920 [Clostridium sp.]|nr:MAG: hypothetical protein L6U99_04920 [Clostridium sp.]